MATRNINTFIQHLMNENLAATQAAVTAGTAVKQKKREQRSDAEKRDDALRGLGIYGPVKPKGGRRLLDMDTESVSGLSSIPGIGAKFIVDKLKAKSPAAAKEFTDSGNYGPKKAGGVRDRMKKSTPSGSAGGY